MLRDIITKMNQGPWGPWSSSKPNKDDDINSDKNKSSLNKDSENKQFSLKDFVNFSESGSGGGGGSKNNDFFDSFNRQPKKRKFAMIASAILCLWLILGFYKVDPDENGVVLYFGKFYSVSTPGLNYRIPFPFSTLIKESVTTVNSEEFGYNSKFTKGKKDDENLMLTGDENIVDIEFQVQWQISNIENYVFNIAEQNLAIRKAAESAMREIIAKTPISEALSDGKSQIEQGTRELLQQTLDSYNSGVRIILVQLRRVDPPKQVIDSFRDVQTAKADKEREINEAQAYANDVIPRARGSAAQMSEQAEAYKRQVVADAEGEAGRFNYVYNQYKGAKQVTKKRIYLETMEKIYRDMDKIIIDKNMSKNGMVYLPVNEMLKNEKK